MSLSRVACMVVPLLLAGCAGRIVTPMQPGPSHEARPPSEHFSYPPSPVQPARLGKAERVDDHYVRTRLVFTADDLDPGGEIGLQVDHFRGTGPAPRPVIIVVPIWGNGAFSYPSDRFSRHIRDRTEGRYDVLEVIGEPPLIRWQHLASASSPEQFRRRAETMVERIRLASITLRRMVDWVASRKQLDADNVAIVGFSMGAIVTTMVLGNDDRFAAGAIVMGGGRFDLIFAHCDGRAGDLRETVLERFGWTTEQYRQLFAEVFEAGQPANFRGNYRPGNILMMDAMFDDCIPKESRESLWRTLGRPERISFLARHRSAFLAFTPLVLNYGGRRILRFLRERLESPPVHESVDRENGETTR